MFMSTQRSFRFYLITLAVTFWCSLGAARGGGVDAGGNGVFMKTPNSKKLVLWDIYVNNPSLTDNETGDQIQLPKQARKGQWIDYRQFKSFSFLKRRLALWAKRAPNFFSAIDDHGFADGYGPDGYKVLLI